MDRYQVIVGNIGTVYSGNDEETANDKFVIYRDHSIGDYGRAAGESVTLFENGEPIKEHIGTVDDA